MTKQKTGPIPNYALYAVIAVIILVAVFVSYTMQDMQLAVHEDNTGQTEKIETKEGERQNLASYWDAEDITAQQVERSTTYRGSANLGLLIENLENNLQYNRNKGAALFYLALVYEQTDPNKAVLTYQQIRQQFYNHSCNLFILNAPRVPGASKTYYVSLYEESLLREYRLTQNKNLLTQISASAWFGEPGKSFSYGDLLNLNAAREAAKLPMLTSYDQYNRLAEARLNINALVSEEEVTASPSATVESLDFISLRKGQRVYYYTFKQSDTKKQFIATDDGEKILITRTN